MRAGSFSQASANAPTRWLPRWTPASSSSTARARRNWSSSPGWRSGKRRPRRSTRAHIPTSPPRWPPRSSACRRRACERRTDSLRRCRACASRASRVTSARRSPTRSRSSRRPARCASWFCSCGATATTSSGSTWAAASACPTATARRRPRPSSTARPWCARSRACRSRSSSSPDGCWSRTPASFSRACCSPRRATAGASSSSSTRR